MNEHKEIREVLKLIKPHPFRNILSEDRFVSVGEKQLFDWLRQLLDENQALKGYINTCESDLRFMPKLLEENQAQSTELERLKAWAATVINNYHHVLTYGLTQEGIALIKEGGEKHG